MSDSKQSVNTWRRRCIRHSRATMQRIDCRLHAVYYLRQAGYAFTCVCLSVCLLTRLFKNYWLDLLWKFTEWLDIIQGPVD